MVLQVRIHFICHLLVFIQVVNKNFPVCLFLIYIMQIVPLEQIESCIDKPFASFYSFTGNYNILITTNYLEFS